MGSKSDAELVQPALDTLKELGIDYEVNVISAHRTPEKARQYQPRDWIRSARATPCLDRAKSVR